MESRPECVMLVRSILAGVADALELGAELADDMRTAVSEACNNVVQHAYGDGTGPLLVTVTAIGTGLAVRVSDHGEAMRSVAPADGHIGIGLPVIGALAERTEIESTPASGTTVRMSFHHSEWIDGAFGESGPAIVEAPDLGLEGDVVGQVRPAELLSPVLGRATRAIAAGSHFSIERFRDLYALTDAIAAHAAHAAAAEPLCFSISASARRLEVTVGPFRTGSCTALIEAHRSHLAGPPAGARPAEYELSADSVQGLELLHALVIDHRPRVS